MFIIVASGYFGVRQYQNYKFEKAYNEKIAAEQKQKEDEELKAQNDARTAEMENLKTKVNSDVDRYINFMNQQGYYAQGISLIGVDVIDQVTQVTPQIVENFPNAVFFGGQLLFSKDSFFAPLFHNYAVFSIQKKLYRQGVPFVILPIRI